MKLTDKHGKEWQLVPVKPVQEQMNAAYCCLVESPEAVYGAMLSATPEPELPEGLEPVAYLHEERNRSDVITKEVKKLLHDAAQSCDYLHRPIDKSEHYTEPLVLQSAALVALAEKDAEIAKLHTMLPDIPKRERECKTLDDWRLRAIYLESEYASCSRGLSVKASKDAETIQRQAALLENCRKALVYLTHRTADDGCFIMHSDLRIVEETLAAIEKEINK